MHKIPVRFWKSRGWKEQTDSLLIPDFSKSSFPFPHFSAAPLPSAISHGLWVLTLFYHHFLCSTATWLFCPFGAESGVFPAAPGQSLCHWCIPSGFKVPPLKVSNSEARSIWRVWNICPWVTVDYHVKWRSFFPFLMTELSFINSLSQCDPTEVYITRVTNTSLTYVILFSSARALKQSKKERRELILRIHFT